MYDKNIDRKTSQNEVGRVKSVGMKIVSLVPVVQSWKKSAGNLAEK